jgi:hypothetical protein
MTCGSWSSVYGRHVMAALTVLAVALLGHGLVSGRLRGLAITGPMVFVAVGFLTGSEVCSMSRRLI